MIVKRVETKQRKNVQVFR